MNSNFKNANQGESQFLSNCCVSINTYIHNNYLHFIISPESQNLAASVKMNTMKWSVI